MSWPSMYMKRLYIEGLLHWQNLTLFLGFVRLLINDNPAAYICLSSKRYDKNTRQVGKEIFEPWEIEQLKSTILNSWNDSLLL